MGAGSLLAESQALHVRTFPAICLWTAARSATVLQLTWDRVDLIAGMIDFGSVTDGKGSAVVPIADSLRSYLSRSRQSRDLSMRGGAWQQAGRQRENWGAGRCAPSQGCQCKPARAGTWPRPGWR
jgi:hypothetical protein